MMFLDLNDPKKYKRRSVINLVLKGESCCYYRLTGKKEKNDWIQKFGMP